MFAETSLAVAVVYCSALFAATAAASDPRVGSYGSVIFENDSPAANEQRFHTGAAVGTRRPCCGGYSSSTADAITYASDAFATDASTVEVTDKKYRTPKEIPLSVIKELNQVSNVSELFSKFMPDVDMRDAQNRIAETGFQSRISMNIERKAALIPKAADCTVELRTISLKDTDDPSFFYYPSCTRVNRCGGCCAHDLLACQPIKSETLHFEVMVSQYNGPGKLEFKGRKPVTVEQHMKCKCDCIVQAKDCNELQTYHQNDCRCMCNNEEDRDKCTEEYSTKLWNSATCTCQCRETQECTSGFRFDFNTCRCEADRAKSKINSGFDFNQNVYSLGQ